MWVGRLRGELESAGTSPSLALAPRELPDRRRRPHQGRRARWSMPLPLALPEQGSLAQVCQIVLLAYFLASSLFVDYRRMLPNKPTSFAQCQTTRADTQSFGRIIIDIKLLSIPCLDFARHRFHTFKQWSNPSLRMAYACGVKGGLPGTSTKVPVHNHRQRAIA